MNVIYDVQIPDIVHSKRSSRKRSEEYIKIKEFIESAHESMCFSYDNRVEAKKRRQSIDVTIRREKLPVMTVIRNNKMYVIKK